MTRVSAELKMARSLVRLAEIQATLHEQRYDPCIYEVDAEMLMFQCRLREVHEF